MPEVSIHADGRVTHRGFPLAVIGSKPLWITLRRDIAGNDRCGASAPPKNASLMPVPQPHGLCTVKAGGMAYTPALRWGFAAKAAGLARRKRRLRARV